MRDLRLVFARLVQDAFGAQAELASLFGAAGLLEGSGEHVEVGRYLEVIGAVGCFVNLHGLFQQDDGLPGAPDGDQRVTKVEKGDSSGGMVAQVLPQGDEGLPVHGNRGRGVPHGRP